MNQHVTVPKDSIQLKMIPHVNHATQNVRNVYLTQTVPFVTVKEYQVQNQIAHAQMVNMLMKIAFAKIVPMNV